MHKKKKNWQTRITTLFAGSFSTNQSAIFFQKWAHLLFLKSMYRYIRFQISNWRSQRSHSNTVHCSWTYLIVENNRNVYINIYFMKIQQTWKKHARFNHWLTSAWLLKPYSMLKKSNFRKIWNQYRSYHQIFGIWCQCSEQRQFVRNFILRRDEQCLHDTFEPSCSSAFDSSPFG